MRMSDRLYDTLKWVQKICVLLAAFYKGIAAVWGLPYGSEVSQTFLLIATFLLGILEMASATYNKELTSSPEMDDVEIAEHEVEEEVG